MKKVLFCMLALAMAMVMLTACGGDDDGEKKEGFDLDSLKTLGDAFDLDGDDDEFASDYSQFVYVFENDDVTYRVYADLSKDVAKKYEKLDAADEDYEDKVKELVAPMEITKRENLSDGIPTQEELDKYVGKTGKELMDDGWTVSGWDNDDKEFMVNHGPYEIKATVEGDVKGSDDMDTDAEFSKQKIKSLKYSDISNAAVVESDQENQ